MQLFTFSVVFKIDNLYNYEKNKIHDTNLPEHFHLPSKCARKQQLY